MCPKTVNLSTDGNEKLELKKKMLNWKVQSRIRELSKRVQAIDRSIIQASLPFFKLHFTG